MIIEIFYELDYLPAYKKAIATMNMYSLVSLGRFVCATILHLSLIEEIEGAMVMMKYAVNHQYMFKNPINAYMIAFMQFFITTMVEICNLIVILASNDPLNIVLNFVAICIVAEFDNLVFASQRNENCIKMLDDNAIGEKILQIQHTTSKSCHVDELSNVKDEEGNYRKMRIVYSERPCGQKCMYTLYKVCRIWYVSFYVYFLPFMSIILNIVIPVYVQDRNNPVIPIPPMPMSPQMVVS